MTELAGWTGVGALAVLGALARITVDAAVRRRVRLQFPLPTLAVNTSGSLALGVLAGAGTSGWALRLAGAALIGSFTTFSTWIFESGRLADEGELFAAGLNVAGSLLLGLGAVALGWSIGAAL
jgi:CrcB protein